MEEFQKVQAMYPGQINQNNWYVYIIYRIMDDVVYRQKGNKLPIDPNKIRYYPQLRDLDTTIILPYTIALP